MAELALPPGARRRRTVFGLLDADGWTWATIKATFWFLLIIFLLGYVPDRAYYFTVSPTLDVGYNAISPINLCPAENRTLPCPAPAGAVVPWQTSPAELALPDGRARAGTYASAETLYVVGGETAAGATASVLTATVVEGNLTGWTEAPALPEPRAGATLINLSGTPYVVGGADASGAPTATVFRGVVEEGLLTGWEAADELALPVPLMDAVGVATGTAMWLFGGRGEDGAPVATTYHSAMNASATEQEPWTEVTELPLPEARARASAVSSGGSVYVIGGEGPAGPTNTVFYLALTSEGEPAIDSETDRPFGWGVSAGPAAGAALPEPRYGHSSFVNSGAVYVIGGFTADGSVAQTNLWSNPDAANGTIDEWIRLDATDLPNPRAGAAPAVIGSYAFVIGGTDGSQALDSVVRADLAPRPPFFRLGLFGATIPALGIEGEIGQQLGYIIAGSAGAGNLILLILIGWAFSHREQTYRFFEWISRGRFRAPRERDYGV